MNLVDAVYRFATGGWKTDRMISREQRRLNEIAVKGGGTHGGKFYAAANPGVKRPSAPQLYGPEDYRQAYERIVMIRYARQAEDDLPYVEGILSDFETYVIGELRYRANSGNPNADKVINDFLEFQFCKSQCDYSGKLDLTSLAKLAIRSKKRDGECGFVYVDVGDTVKLFAVEADCIGNPLLGSNVGPDNYNGIIVDPSTGEPIFYDLWRRLPKLNAYVYDKRIPANSFIQFWDPFRFSQYHGVTPFKNGISRAIDVEQAIQFAIQNMKFHSSQLPVVHNEQGRPKGNGYEQMPVNSQGVAVPLLIDVDNVQQTWMKVGESNVTFPHDFPNANFVEVSDSLKGDICIGMKLPPEFCFRSNAGGVLQRFYIEKAQRTFDEEKRLAKTNLLNPFKNRKIQKGIDSGFLNLSAFPGLSTSMARFQGNWHMGRSVSTDYGKDVDADIKLIDANLMGEEEYLSEMARDPAEIRNRKRQRALEIFQDAVWVAAQVGRPVGEVLPFIQKQSPNPILQEKVQDPTGAIIASDGSQQQNSAAAKVEASPPKATVPMRP
jgi:Phage portal protein, lambda family